MKRGHHFFAIFFVVGSIDQWDSVTGIPVTRISESVKIRFRLMPIDDDFLTKWPKSAKINRVPPFVSEILDLFFKVLWAKRSKNGVFSENRHLRASNEKFSSIFTFFSIFEIFGKLRVFRQKSKKMTQKVSEKNSTTSGE